MNSRNKTPVHDRTTIAKAVDAARLATGLQIAVQPRTIEVSAQNKKHRFEAEVKNVDRFAVPALLKARERTGRTRRLLVAPYISREVARHCRDLQLPFIDAAGNAYLEGPGLFVYVVGSPKPADLRPAEYRALTAAGLQVTFALLCNPQLAQAGYREIARQAGVALGTVGHVVDDLRKRYYLLGRELRNAGQLLEDWVTHYPVALRPKLQPTRFAADPSRLRDLGLVKLKAQWSGEMAADRLTNYLKPGHYTIYTQEPLSKLAVAARMRADPQGNVEVLHRFWQFDAEPSHSDLVPAILVYADLISTHDSRNVETAKLIHEQYIAPKFRETPDPDRSSHRATTPKR